VSTFANELVKDIIRDQSANIRSLDLIGHGVKLDLKRLDTGAVVASLDIPITLHINVSDLAVTLRDTTIKLDVVR